MIQRDGHDMQLVCDECGSEHPKTWESDEFTLMISMAKSDGWTIEPDGEGGWTHTCCKPKSRLDKAKALFR